MTIVSDAILHKAHASGSDGRPLADLETRRERESAWVDVYPVTDATVESKPVASSIVVGG